MGSNKGDKEGKKYQGRVVMERKDEKKRRMMEVKERNC